jgi:hypothetical protein
VLLQHFLSFSTPLIEPSPLISVNFFFLLWTPAIIWGIYFLSTLDVSDYRECLADTHDLICFNADATHLDPFSNSIRLLSDFTWTRA